MKPGITMIKLRLSLRILAVLLAALLFTRIFLVGRTKEYFGTPKSIAPAENNGWSEWYHCQVAKSEKCAHLKDPMTHVPQQSGLDKALQTLFSHVVISPTAQTFTTDDGITHGIKNSPIWKTNMGSDICIMDIDNRQFNEEGQTWGPGHFVWEEQKNQGSGLLNHYLYAIIHGYRYNYVTIPIYEGERSAFWAKIPAMSDMLLSGCRIVVTIDHDAIFQNLNLPFEWLLNRWNFTQQTSIAMALDNHITPWTPTQLGNEDDYGELNINAGFVIAQNNPRTHEILRAWDSCPSNETQYPNCRKFISEWPAEQGAFGTYIRRQFTKPDDNLEIPCTEANGFPGMNTECEGIFIRHFTTEKALVNKGVASSLSQSFFGMVHRAINERAKEIKITREFNGFTKSFDYPGGGVYGDPKPEGYDDSNHESSES